MGRPKIVYWSSMAGIQSEGRFYMVGKGCIMVVLLYYYNRIPTYHIGSSEDSAWCRCSMLVIHYTANDPIWSKDCIGLLRYDAGSNKPSLRVVICLGRVERFCLGNKLSLMVRVRSLCSRSIPLLYQKQKRPKTLFFFIN
jgi:hypothetical protein